MLTKINLSNILTSHLDTLKNDNTGKADFDDYLTFLIIPLIVSVVLIGFKLYLKEAAVSLIIAILAIIVGLLFNVIVIIFDIIKRDNTQKIKNKILEQLLSNISYTILISIISILLSISTYLDFQIIKIVSNFLVYFALSHYLMTVLMILKRMYALFSDEIKVIGNTK